MRLDIREQMRRSRDSRTVSCSANLPINSTITVRINKKKTPCKTTIARKGNLVEATANGKKYLCEWWFGEWIGTQI